MFNPSTTFSNVGTGAVNHQLGSTPPPFPMDEPTIVAPTNVSVAIPEPIVAEPPVAPAAPVVPATPNAPIAQNPPDLNAPPAPEVSLDNKNTFYLLAEALKAKGYLSDEFALEEATSDASKFVEATGKYFQENISAIEAQTMQRLEQEYGQAAKDIEFYRNGGSLEVLEHLEPFKNSLSYDISKIDNEDQKLQLKQVIINQALYVTGTQDPEVRQLAIEGYLAKGSLDTVYEQSKATIAKYINTTETAEIENAKAIKLAQETKAAEEQQKYVNSIKNFINKGTIGDIKLSPKDTEFINQGIFGAKTEVIEQLGQDNKVKAIPATRWEKFIHNFYNNPEVQVQAFYNFERAGSGTSSLKQVAQNEYANKILDNLNARTVESSTQFQPNVGQPAKFLHKL